MAIFSLSLKCSCVLCTDSFKAKNHKGSCRKVRRLNLMVKGERGRDVDPMMSHGVSREQIAIMATLN